MQERWVKTDQKKGNIHSNDDTKVIPLQSTIKFTGTTHFEKVKTINELPPPSKEAAIIHCVTIYLNCDLT